jgi:hypothetical protein
VKQLTTTLISRRPWSALALAALMVATAPAIVFNPTGRANEPRDVPWNDPWSGPWPALLDRSNVIDPQVAALQQRIDASLERLMKASGEAALSGQVKAELKAEMDSTLQWYPSQVAER